MNSPSTYVSQARSEQKYLYDQTPLDVREKLRFFCDLSEMTVA